MRISSAVIALACLTLVACGAKQQTDPGADPAVTPEPTSSSPLEAACESGTAKSCLLAANDAETAGDIEKATKLYNAACELGDANGCALAGGLLGDAGDLEGARAAFDAGCKLDDATSCYGLGLVVAGSFGGEADLGAAVPAFQRGCELGLAASCGDLAGLYRSGTGVEVDLERADALREQACEGGDGESCVRLGLQAWQNDDRETALTMFERSCGTELPDPTGCGYYGWMLWSGDEGDAARGIALMDSSCEAGAAVGCSLRASTHARNGEVDQGKALLQQACQLDAERCEEFSEQFRASTE